jgi:membrane dipeptidase
MSCGCHETWAASLAQFFSALTPNEPSVDRRQALGAIAAVGLAGCGAPVTAAQRDDAQRLAQETVSVDLHSHPGMFSAPLSLLSTDEQLVRMTSGRLKAALFAAVGDGPLIGRRPQGGLYATREPRPGELYGYTYRSLDSVRARVTAGKAVLILTPADLDSARTQGQPGVILAVEGGDFLDGRIDRVQEAHGRGIRSIQLTHYRVNELGDIQTEPAIHGGLTAFGKDVIREMNRLGMVIDVAHLTHDGVRQAVELSRKPVILSHTVLEAPWARAVSREHARLVSTRGGVIGIFPVNIYYYGFSGYIEHISKMIKAVGVDHVGVGTDMDGISPASFCTYSDYSEWPSIGGALLARGYSREDVAKVTGGNFLRVFREVSAV